MGTVACCNNCDESNDKINLSQTQAFLHFDETSPHSADVVTIEDSGAQLEELIQCKPPTVDLSRFKDVTEDLCLSASSLADLTCFKEQDFVLPMATLEDNNLQHLKPTMYFAREEQELRHFAEQCYRDNCFDTSHCEKTFETGAVYKGQWLGGERHGIGCHQWQDGATYIGKWDRNMATGRGQFKYPDGSSYTGQWKQNQAHGFGICRFADGMTFDGLFFYDLPDGSGQQTWPCGTSYSGSYKNGKKDGWGVYTWSDGSKYIGHWHANNMHGSGSWSGADGRALKSKWAASEINGFGVYRWPDGRTYAGSFCNNLKEGFGIMCFTDGSNMEGFWLAGQAHGIARLVPKSKDKSGAESQPPQLVLFKHGVYHTVPRHLLKQLKDLQ